MARKEILLWIAASMSIFTNMRGRAHSFKISSNHLAHNGRGHKGIKRRTCRLELSIRFFTWWGWWRVLGGDIGEGAFDGKFRANGSWLRLIEEQLPSLRNGGHHLSEKYNMKHSRHSFILLKNYKWQVLRISLPILIWFFLDALWLKLDTFSFRV